MKKYVVRIIANDKCAPDKSSENRSFIHKDTANNYLLYLATKYGCTTNDKRTGMFWAKRMYSTKYSVELSIEQF